MDDYGTGHCSDEKGNFFCSKIKKNWKDEFMTWNPAEYDNITVMRILYAQIWNPGI